MLRILGVQFLRSVVSVKGIGNEDVPEICFIGRSNVGKSSMINTLVGRKIARTSATPGATQMVNLFLTSYEADGKRGSFIISDFPGYGYSRAPKSVSQSWQQMVESYILGNQRIRLIIWLFDVRREMDELDEMLMEWLSENEMKFCLILTKSDKERQGNIVKKKRLFNAAMSGKPVLLHSSKTGEGKGELLGRIGQVLSHTVQTKI